MKKIVAFSLSAFSLLGLLKIFSIIPFNRMAADDFSVAIPAKISIWEAVISTYNVGNGRFVATFLQSVFVLMTGDSGKIMFYSLITFGLLLFALLIFFKKLLGAGFGNFYIYLLSSASFAFLYFLSPNKSESWYWLTGSATYLWSIILFLFSASFLLEDKPAKFKYLTASVLAFASVACNETFGLLVVTILLALFLTSWVAKKKNYLALTMFVFSLTSFSIMYMAPGNNIRAQGGGSSPMSLGGSILYSIQEGPNHIFSMVKNNLYIIIPLLIVFTYIFSKLINFSKEKMNSGILLTRIFMALTVPVVLSIVYMLPAFKVLGRIQPDRSDVSLAFIIAMSVVAAAFYLSRLLDFENPARFVIYNIIFFSAAVALFIASFSFTSTLAGDIYIVKNYSQAYDEMINGFKKSALLGDKKDLVVELPKSGLIPVTLDPPGYVFYKNQTLSQFYGVGRIISK